MEKDNQIEKLILLGLKAVCFRPKIKSGYLIHQLFSHWKIPINFIHYLNILEDRELIKKKFYDKDNYTFSLTEKGRKLGEQADIIELTSKEFNFDKEKILDFFKLT